MPAHEPARPTVSVIIPAYNQGHYLGKAIKSVLDQNFQDFEVLIVDDGSTDNTAEVAQSFEDPRVRYIFQDNRGLSGARNTGIRNAAGDYLSYLDSDDLFHPEKLSLLMEALKDNPALGFAAGQAIPIDENDCEVGRIFDSGLPENLAELLLGNPLHVGSVLIRRNWQEKVGFFDESLRSYEDWDMWLRLARAGCSMGWVPKPVSFYRFHTTQMTRDGTQMTEATFAVLEKIYGDPTLPPDWWELKGKSFSNAFLRAAAQSYLAKDYPAAQDFLSSAVAFNPELAARGGQELANRFSSWIELPKIHDPIDFLDSIYANLPAELQALETQGRKKVGEVVLGQAFQQYNQGDYTATRKTLFRAFVFHPGFLLNRGVLSIFIRSLLSQEAG